MDSRGKKREEKGQLWQDDLVREKRNEEISLIFQFYRTVMTDTEEIV